MVKCNNYLIQYVEKYVFQESIIEYQVVASCTNESSYFGWSNTKDIFKDFISSYFKIDKIQGSMMQYQDKIKEKIKVSGDPAFNEENNMQNSIPSEFMKGFYSLRK